MATSAKIIEALKQQLKARGITYKGLAARLELSESAIKHMFSTGNLSLKRLDALCAVIDMEMSELAEVADTQTPRIDVLPAELEAELVADYRLLLIAYCLVNYWSFEEILERYTISRADGVKLLRRLDRMRLIELQPGDRVRLLISNNFRWQKNGAIERFFRSKVQAEFFNNSFTADGAVRIVKDGMLSKTGQLQLVDKLRIVGDQFDEVTRDERKLSAAQRQGTTMVLAIRNWFFEGFRDLER